MTETPFLHSLACFREIVLQLLDAAGARHVAEIGAEYGTFTRELCERARRTGGRLTSIDPAPRPEAVEFIGRHRDDPHFTFLERTSLEALPTLAGVDAYVIDGDHNYHTVRGELEVIAELHRRDGRPLLVFEHDVEWPFGRRDLYYDPERIPAEARQPYSREGGAGVDEPRLVPGGWGDGQGLAIAVEEGGPRNGVKTAIEDFMAGHPELRFEVIPAVFGLGVVYSREAPWAPAVAELLRPLAGNPLIERLERNRTRLVCMALREHHEKVKAPGMTAGYLWGPHLLEVFQADDKPGFDRLFEGRLARRLREQEPLAVPGAEEFDLPGFCVVCGRPSLFRTDYRFAAPGPDGTRSPAWRERQTCACGLNCRQRSSYHVLTQLPGLTPDAAVCCTESGTLFEHVSAAFPGASAVAPGDWLAPPGSRPAPAAASFDALFTLELLERAADVPRVLRDFARVLRPGGWLALTVPFRFDRAAPAAGDPPARRAGSAGGLGWELLDGLRDAGFPEVGLLVFTAPHYGYVGLQYVIAARRGTGHADGADSPRSEEARRDRD